MAAKRLYCYSMTNTQPRRRAARTVSQSAHDWKPVGDRLRALRERAAQSRAVAAEVTGVNPLTLIRYESGARPPSIDALLRYARAYRVTTDWILTGSRKAV